MICRLYNTKRLESTGLEQRCSHGSCKLPWPKPIWSFKMGGKWVDTNFIQHTKTISMFLIFLAWLQKHVAKPGAFIPFGGGPRICPGADLAKLEISIFLHCFLLNYKWAHIAFIISRTELEVSNYLSILSVLFFVNLQAWTTESRLPNRVLTDTKALR